MAEGWVFDWIKQTVYPRTIFSSTKRCNIVPTLFQRCVALKIVVANRPVWHHLKCFVTRSFQKWGACDDTRLRTWEAYELKRTGKVKPLSIQMLGSEWNRKRGKRGGKRGETGARAREPVFPLQTLLFCFSFSSTLYYLSAWNRLSEGGGGTPSEGLYREASGTWQGRDFISSSI